MGPGVLNSNTEPGEGDIRSLLGFRREKNRQKHTHCDRNMGEGKSIWNRFHGTSKGGLKGTSRLP